MFNIYKQINQRIIILILVLLIFSLSKKLKINITGKLYLKNKNAVHYMNTDLYVTFNRKNNTLK